MTRTRYNNLHRVVLDDGSSRTFWNTANNADAQDDPLSWFTQDHQVRVGAAVTFPEPVILENRFGWKIQPTTDGQRRAERRTSRSSSRTARRRPSTSAVTSSWPPSTCSTTSPPWAWTTTPAGHLHVLPRPRGQPDRGEQLRRRRTARRLERRNFERQQDKIVNAINTMDADIVSLEEIENSRKVDDIPNRDEAVGASSRPSTRTPAPPVGPSRRPRPRRTCRPRPRRT